ncbi:hypothetical protein TNCV_82871 [Trichonephila clavipes]|nr:hypothetical protein TNCV_82871 [Trichonephila clavipes]
MCFVSDIQEFYEITLLDDTKSIQQKTAETLQIASKWENSPPLASLNQNNEVSASVIFVDFLKCLVFNAFTSRVKWNCGSRVVIASSSSLDVFKISSCSRAEAR